MHFTSFTQRHVSPNRYMPDKPSVTPNSDIHLWLSANANALTIILVIAVDKRERTMSSFVWDFWNVA